MDIELLREYCLEKKGVSEDFPFDQDVLAFRVGTKIFLLTNLSQVPLSFNVKCDPEKAVVLREEYSAVQPGYHMNKRHWNTITVDGSIAVTVLKELIDHSYDLVFAKLTRAERDEILRAE